MKKNRMMRAASALLVAVLMTTCTISGTFAKYVTSDDAEDSARVAKWGVTVEANGVLFGEQYKDQIVDAADATMTVQVKDAASVDQNVVAPGTKNTTGMSFTVAGAPEVDVTVEKEASLTLTGWEIDSAYYCPLTIFVNGAEFKGMTYASMAEFEAAVEGAINGVVTKQSNESLAETLTITWEWPFEVGTTPDEIAENDVKDTKLGDLAVAPTIAFDCEVTVTQVD